MANFLLPQMHENQQFTRVRQLSSIIVISISVLVPELPKWSNFSPKAKRLKRNKPTCPRFARRVWINELITGRSAAVMARCCGCRSPVSSSVFSVMEIARAFNHRASERRSSMRLRTRSISSQNEGLVHRV